MIDLHLHLDGSLEPEDVPLLAQLSGVTLEHSDPEALRRELSVSEGCTSLVEYLQKFDLPIRVLQSAPALKLAAERLVCRLAAQGLCYAELRFAPQCHLQQGLTQKQVVRAVRDGMRAGTEESGMPAQLILCCMRFDDNHRANLETLEAAAEFLGDGVCALDLAGDEAGHPTWQYNDLFQLARSRGIPFVLHGGEAAGPESVEAALALGAQRIGHGTRSIENEKTVAALARLGTPLEMCYISNLNTCCVPGPEAYPFKKLRDAGVRVTINTDNMSVSGTTLHREYRELQALYGFTPAELRDIAKTAADCALLPAPEREKLKQQIEQRFDGWLAAGE